MTSTEPEGDRVHRPRVVVAVDMSVDARVTLRRDRLLLDPANGQEWAALSAPSAAALEELRTAQIERVHHPEVTLEGSGSLVPDTAGPAFDPAEPVGESDEVLYADFLPAEKVDDPTRRTWFAVVDSRGRVRWTMTRGGGAEVLVLVAKATPRAYLSFLRAERICYLVVGDDRVDLPTALRRLRERLGVSCVRSAAGGGLNGALLRAGLVDEVQLTIMPAVIGGRDTPTIFDGPELGDGEPATRLRLLSSHAETDGMIWLRYEVVR